MAARCNLEFGPTGSSAFQLADPENLTLEPHMKWLV